MVHEKQPHIEYGFKDMMGKNWPDAWVDTYNRYTDAINKSADIDITSGSLMEKTREQLLNNRHAFYVTCANLV